MALFSIKNVEIKGIACCVPSKEEKNSDISFLSKEEKEKLIASTGIENRRISTKAICSSDLCVAAAEKLIKDIQWNKDEIEVLIFVTQTPDYILPATSCILQDRLGLKESCYTLDISLGCSGWVYGLSTLASLLSATGMKKSILLAGDTVSKLCSDSDKSSFPLFGDAGTATAIEFREGAKGFHFHTGSDGSGFETIIVPDGGYRNTANRDSFKEEEISDGIKRSKLNLILEGMDIFTFGISKAPESVNKLIEHFSLDKEKIDYFVFHQANLFMNEKIRKKLKLPEEKVPYSLRNFGNTSSATIPLTIVTELKNNLINFKKEIIACGFGVGLSWGSVYLIADNIVCSDLLEI
ncbi:MAG: ketoacyl-ACP synthase III [Candidatus Symbiothrix sp.]|jgi:3-oxoacyl-[acyl-carrier-protein] synthase-3|nr:ketoacyl-ACP synthase III [Candidatus Symbiothrix sp.]